MINATAPMTGGMIWPPIDATASTPPAKAGRNPDRFISGIVNAPVVTTLATPEPLIVPMRADEITDTFAGPPRDAPTVPMAMSLKSWIMPARSRNAPNRIKRKI